MQDRYGPTTRKPNTIEGHSASTIPDTSVNDESTDEIVGDDSENIQAPNGGWGWMCVIGCQISLFMLVGLMRAFGVFYLELLDKFGEGAAATAWVGGLQNAILFLMSPVASILTERFTTRWVVFVGGIICTASLVLSSFAPNLSFLYFSWGLLLGVGGTLTYSPSIVIVGKYFTKRRSLAVGLAASSSGLGAFTMPILVRYLMRHYGYFGAMLLQGGMLLHICISGALFRPLKDNFRTKGIRSQKRLKSQDKETEAKIELLNTCNGNEVKGQGAQNVMTETVPGKDTESSNSPASNKPSTKQIYLELFKDPAFLSFSLTILIGTFGYVSLPTFLPAIARERGMTPSQCAIILSTSGISDGICRIVLGFFLDMKHIRPHRINLYMLVILSFAVYAVAFCHCYSLTGFLVIAVLFGASESIFWVQRPVIAADLLGVDKLSSSHGLLLFFQGIGVMLGPVVGGWMTDVYTTYVPTFYFCAATIILAVTLFYIGRIFEAVRSCLSKSNSKPAPEHI